MARYLAGAVAMVLAIAAGVFLWTGLAHGGASLGGKPPAKTGGSTAASLALPPQASDASREQKRFMRYDRDRNGAIARDEYLFTRRRSFDKLDTDRDGKLSFDEYAAKTSVKFTKADADHSGTLNAAEFATTQVVRKAPARCACPQGGKDDD